MYLGRLPGRPHKAVFFCFQRLGSGAQNVLPWEAWLLHQERGFLALVFVRVFWGVQESEAKFFGLYWRSKFCYVNI